MKRFCTFMLLLVCFAVNAEGKGPQFQSEEITFKSVGEVSLSGSLTLPNGKGPYPAIVLLGGSERLGRMAIYNWATADSFVSQGIAVFSFDSPGTGKSEGNRWRRTHKERTEDALAAVRAIQKREDIDRDSIGLYGVSEGGSIVFRATSLSKHIAFGIAVSAPAVPHYRHMEILTRSLEGNPETKALVHPRESPRRVGGRSFTTAQWVQQFVAACNDEQAPLAPPQRRTGGMSPARRHLIARGVYGAKARDELLGLVGLPQAEKRSRLKAIRGGTTV